MSKLPDPPEDLSLEGACDTDEVYDLAFKLAAWALRDGMDPGDVVDWVLDQPREGQLPRGSHARLNPTKHHVLSGATNAVDQYVPGLRPLFDPDPLHELAARIAGSGVTHEKYLLGVVALCFKYETLTPVVTGPLLALATGVGERVAGKVLSKWSATLAYGFFTNVTYDGVRGHGRIWTVDSDWVPASKPTHEPGCNRAVDRCGCRKQGHLYLQLRKIDDPKCDKFQRWVTGLKPGTGITTTDVCAASGVTRHAASKILRAAEGSLVKEGTFKGGQVRKRGSDGVYRWTRQGETWFVADAPTS